jgi:hypothetical protein
MIPRYICVIADESEEGEHQTEEEARADCLDTVMRADSGFTKAYLCKVVAVYESDPKAKITEVP